MSDRKGLLSGKRGVIMGAANNRSIAWGIAKKAADEGAELAFTFQGDQLEKRVRPLAESIGSNIILPCDVTDASSIEAVFSELEKNGVNLISLFMQLPIRIKMNSMDAT